MSINKSVKPKTNETKAIKPKSDGSRKRARTDILINELAARITVEIVVHLTPKIACFLIFIGNLCDVFVQFFFKYIFYCHKNLTTTQISRQNRIFVMATIAIIIILIVDDIALLNTCDFIYVELVFNYVLN